jgi:hypothetical protein
MRSHTTFINLSSAQGAGGGNACSFFDIARTRPARTTMCASAHKLNMCARQGAIDKGDYRVGRAVQAKKTAFCGFFQKKRAPLYLVVAQRQTPKSSAACSIGRRSAENRRGGAAFDPLRGKSSPPPPWKKLRRPLRGKSSPPSVEKVQRSLAVFSALKNARRN